MHFAKPNPAYYAEILARVGVEPDETLHIGDSLNNDVLPAQTLGLHCYQITPKTPLDALANQVIKANWLETLVERRLLPSMIAPQYRGNIGALYGLLDTVQPHFWKQQPDPNEWSILQILCHLAESETTVQRPRLERILNEERPFLAEPRTPPGPEMPICDDDGYRIAEAFTSERSNTLSLVESLSVEAWQRPARHSIFGPTTLLEMAHFTAQHDRLHLTQLCQTIGHCA
ncbi:HAD-IA family hydrolase [bacterium]|nr:HAD-IA family hydrolase [bacterium]